MGFRFAQATQKINNVADPKLDPEVYFTTNEEERKFIIKDTGIGMSRDELIENLGTIAKSGSLQYLQGDNVEASTIIGQFGVGFYSSFIVADKVDVYSKSGNLDLDSQGHHWTSDGSGSFMVRPVENLTRGTKIVLSLKDDVAEFSKMAAAKKAGEKFSSFINFPIFVEEDGEKKKLNTQDALWLKMTVKPDEHTEFFRFLNGTSYGEPYYSLLYKTDAPLSIKSCFYIANPDNAPSRLFTRDPDLGVSLYSRRVLVSKQAEGVIPKWLHWVKGVVDCEDMPMNISRESMQDSRLVGRLSMAVVRRILRFLIQQAKRDSEKYGKFFTGYSYYLKAGLIEDKEVNMGRHQEDLLKLLRFETSTHKKDEVISLEEYLEGAKDGQKNIYYFSCPDRKIGLSSPYMELFLKHERSVLFMYEEIDEFVVNAVESFKGHKFVSIDSTNQDFELDLDAPEETDEKKRELTSAEKEELQKYFKDILKEKVQEIKFSDRLLNSPALVTSLITPHMRKMMKNLMAGRENDGMGNVPVTLELSPSHHVVTTLFAIKDSNDAVARIAVEQIFDTACIAAGMLDDPRTLLARLNKVLEMFVYQGAGFDYAKGEYVTETGEVAKPKESEPPKFEEIKKAEPPKFEEIKK